MLYPYAYLVGFFASLLLLRICNGDEKTTTIIATIFICLYNVYCWGMSFVNSIMQMVGKYSAYQAAKMNLIIKCAHFPSYIFHLFVMMVGLVLSVWGIGFIFFAIAVDCATIVLAAINYIGCGVQICKEGIISKKKTFLYCVLNFCIFIDVIVAIKCFLKARRKMKEINQIIN